MPEQDMKDYLPFLRGLARGKVLEIGVCAGVSTSAFLLGMDDKNAGHLWSVDIDSACNRFDHPRWTFIHGDSREVIFDVDIDILLIDGDHSYEGASSDLRRFAPLVKSGGVVLMHDVQPAPEYLEKSREWFPVEETRRAWDEFVAAHSDWPSEILPGMTGLGVMTKGFSA